MTALGRVIAAREALRAGAVDEADGVLADLERDLRRRIPTEARCPVCNLPFDAPGQVMRHVSNVHPEAVAA